MEGENKERQIGDDIDSSDDQDEEEVVEALASVMIPYVPPGGDRYAFGDLSDDRGDAGEDDEDGARPDEGPCPAAVG